MPANSRWDLIRGLKGYDNVSDLDNTASIDWTTELSTTKCVEEGGPGSPATVPRLSPDIDENHRNTECR